MLVVDDEPVIRRTVARFLEGKGCAVETAADGREALDLARTATYDVIVSDVGMPGLDGGTLWMRACMARPELRDRWVFMSAHPPPRLLLAAGQRYLPKPFDLERLWSTILDVVAPPGGPRRM